jgi:hypothetical protein
LQFHKSSWHQWFEKLFIMHFLYVTIVYSIYLFPSTFQGQQARLLHFHRQKVCIFNIHMDNATIMNIFSKTMKDLSIVCANLFFNPCISCTQDVNDPLLTRSKEIVLCTFYQILPCQHLHLLLSINTNQITLDLHM